MWGGAAGLWGACGGQKLMYFPLYTPLNPKIVAPAAGKISAFPLVYSPQIQKNRACGGLNQHISHCIQPPNPKIFRACGGHKSVHLTLYTAPQIRKIFAPAAG